MHLVPRTYVSLHVTREARAALQRLQLDLTPLAGRRLSLADALLAAVAVAAAHPDEAAAALTSD
jgi:hypothetical protein